MESLYEMGLKIPKCPDCKREMTLTQRSQRIVYAPKREDRDELRMTEHLWCHRCQLYLYIRRHRPAPHTGDKQ
jgi:uncharacterized protein YbaR (Trm112 family)